MQTGANVATLHKLCRCLLRPFSLSKGGLLRLPGVLVHEALKRGEGARAQKLNIAGLSLRQLDGIDIAACEGFRLFAFVLDHLVNQLAAVKACTD
jgi:hypothetical protein